ncbi:MAG TPA: type II toxin-antitoxin system VapC family toxin [Steroidobacter sp.]|uniref:type II toxin-antitoxin system VapC family toxin n=1 Tax=Steroidobacter sp. TaxID=1978227 RepID=UPI002EDBB855
MGQRAVIVLDTHAWIWYATEDPQLSRRARGRIQRAPAIGVHPVSCWEVAMLAQNGRLKLSIDITKWVGHALERPKIELLPFTPAAAIRAAGLGGAFPGDPADRFIVGAALEMKVPVITRDERITRWGHVETIW